MRSPVVLTERLELIPATVELCDAEARGRGALSEGLGALVPDSWPPPVYEPDDVARLRGELERSPHPGFWTLHYLVSRPAIDGSEPDLIGVAGYGGPPSKTGEVWLGYAIAEEHQRQGYATEAVQALVAKALACEEVVAVVATTYPNLEPSIRVLEKSGFVLVKHESDTGQLRYERYRRQTVVLSGGPSRPPGARRPLHSGE
jgi:RimJ/RimL family protein N-acetyltransferase